VTRNINQGIYNMENQWKPDICIYHGNCNDGFGAAWVVRKRWGNDVEYVPAHYGRPLGVELGGKHVLFVDFSLKRAEMENLFKTDTPPLSIVVLDHHETAEAELKPSTCNTPNALEPGLTGQLACIPYMLCDLEALDRPPVIAYFDMNKSGARMAWEFCHGVNDGSSAFRMIQLIEDRDLWKYKFGDETRWLAAALSLNPHDFNSWDAIADNLQLAYDEGDVVLRYTSKMVHDMCDLAGTANIGGYDVPCANVPFAFASDCGHELLRRNPDAPFAATWYATKDGKSYSLRSEDSRIAVSDIAKQFGGGGHRNAAGFKE
jgi:hypothetical protein